jgi:hypothetical protein
VRLPRPFFQLPILFEVERLQAEIAALPPHAWSAHPDRLPGNSAVRLISVDGAETDAVHGAMRPTPWLDDMLYLRQVLASFGVVWSRSRLMRLAPGAGVPEHADISYHWHNRVRLHVPIVTAPAVQFHCDGQSVHMGAGEAWIFDNWRRHHVTNGSTEDRVHLVADTTGTAAFWRFACGQTPPRAQWPTVRWDTAASSHLLTEYDQRDAILPSAEVQLLIDDLRSEVTTAIATVNADRCAAQFDQLLQWFVLDWRQLCALHGVRGAGRSAFRQLGQTLRAAATPLAPQLIMRTNGANAMLVLEKRVLQHLIAEDSGSRA